MDLRVNNGLVAPAMEAMNLLNEATIRYPNAISFAAGRPATEFTNISRAGEWAEKFAVHRAEHGERGLEEVWRELGQYGSTNGVLQELVCRHVARDERIYVSPNAIMITNGFQEAMAVTLLGLFRPGRDVLIVSDPTYIGALGCAALSGVDVWPLSRTRAYAEALGDAVAAVRRAGKTPRGAYVSPDHANPTGKTLEMDERLEVLRVAERAQMIVLEDTAYRYFRYEGESMPTLKALDRGGVVVYLGSFSKSLMPGLRVGFLIADQPCGEMAACRVRTVAEMLSRAKSYVSVSTSGIVQAVAGGALLAEDLSLGRLTAAPRAFYKGNRDLLLNELHANFGDLTRREVPVRWNRPRGGFFVVLELPFEFGWEEMQQCAQEYHVLVIPMCFFSPTGACKRQVRLAFSALSAEQIPEGVRRLALFVRSRCGSAL